MARSKSAPPLALLAVLWAGPALAVDEPSPASPVATIPAPPRQAEPWTPPESAVPKFLVRAAEMLFRQGLADPRGGEYRTIEVMVSGIWGGSGTTIKRRGWVFPAADTAPRFAVGWDGLVWPVAAMGEPADLAADVARLTGPGRVANPDAAEPDPVPTTLDPIQVCLLLRLGRGDLAGTVWGALSGRPDAAPPAVGRPARGAQRTDPNPVSYLAIARDLAWAHFERVATALNRGDDAVVLYDARTLTRLNAAVEREALALGFARPQQFGQRQPEQPAPYIDFLGQLPEILADAERRAAEPARPPIPPPGGPDPTARVAALIRDLDQIVVTQMGQPGGVNLGEARTVQALIAEGDPAVEPLIAALRHDDRLTRSFSFWRDFHRSRTFLKTADAAYAALSGILHTTNFSAGSTGDNLSARGPSDRQQVADRIAAYWDRYKAFPLVERWYQTLRNDGADPGAWSEAAGNITQRTNVRVVPGSSAFTSTVTTQPKPGETPPFRGESLRQDHDPSVTQLLIRRAEALAQTNGISPALALAAMLHAWDPAASLPTLQRVSLVVATNFTPQRDGNHWEVAHQITRYADFTLDRVRLGDQAALADFVTLIRQTEPATFEQNLLPPLEPFYRLPADPTLAAAAEWLFNDPASRWANLYQAGRRFSWRKNLDLIRSPLIRVPGYRRAVLAALDDRTPIGTLTVQPDGKVASQTNEYSSSDITSNQVDPDVPPPGTTAPYRVADQVAEQVARLDGAPAFEVFWPIARRDATIATLRAYLNRYGPRFDLDKPENAPSHDPFQPTAYLTFPTLDHPASPDEVAAGRAVFSLAEPAGAPPAECRVVPLVARPLTAQWTTDRAFPIKQTYTQVGPELVRIEYQNWGQVWQAEEMLEGGVWKRYYGFVGSHRITRVPAEEIEFGERFYRQDGQIIPGGWSAAFRLTTPGALAQYSPALMAPDAQSPPVVVAVRFRNRRGMDQAVPAELTRTEGGHAVALAAQVHLTLESAPLLPPGRNTQARPVLETRWTVVPLKLAIAHFNPPPSLTLRPAESSPEIPLNLTDLFAISQPAQYRLTFRFGPPPLPGAPGEPGPNPASFYFELLDPAHLPRAEASSPFDQSR